mmetsp:Transcript_4006/g.9043  ORF Transcript_4006/g.9043 Transcript_4006/m.9043 type:complete len:131 (-) Transcript_4006:231-623(-)
MARNERGDCQGGGGAVLGKPVVRFSRADVRHAAELAQATRLLTYCMSHAIYSPTLERWYTRCHGLRNIKHALKVKRILSANEWGDLLRLKQDSALGRADTTTLLLTTETLGDKKWHGMNEATAKEVVGPC